VLPTCDESIISKPGCYNVKKNAYNTKIYDLSDSISKLANLEIVFIVIIFIDLIGKLYNDNMVKKDIECRMSKEVTKDVTVSHDQSLEM